MIWLTIGITALISLAALWYVIWPLVDTKPAPLMIEDDRLAELMGQKDTVLKSISQANLDGTGGVNLGNLGGTLNQPWGIALDTANDIMYVTNMGAETITRANSGVARL